MRISRRLAWQLPPQERTPPGKPATQRPAAGGARGTVRMGRSSRGAPCAARAWRCESTDRWLPKTTKQTRGNGPGATQGQLTPRLAAPTAAACPPPLCPSSPRRRAPRLRQRAGSGSSQHPAQNPLAINCACKGSSMYQYPSSAGERKKKIALERWRLTLATTALLGCPIPGQKVGAPQQAWDRAAKGATGS